MPRAFIGNIECRVTVDKDLGDTWAVAVIPPNTKAEPRPPMIVKLQGNDEPSITRGALEILQQNGQIDRFEL